MYECVCALPCCSFDLVAVVVVMMCTVIVFIVFFVYFFSYSITNSPFQMGFHAIFSLLLFLNKTKSDITRTKNYIILVDHYHDDR